ncbi:hypothetical protein ACHAWC_008270 [Mediolabrus comicus]
MIISLLLSRLSFFQSISSTTIGVVSQTGISVNDIDVSPAQLLSSSQLVRRETTAHLVKDPSMAGPLLRLAFHDGATREQLDSTTFVGGPNGSVKYEIDWSENRGITRPLHLIEEIHATVEELSLADCIALAGAEAVEFAGGPSIKVRLGRKDATKADLKKRIRTLQKDTDRSLVETTLPSAGLDSDGLRFYFGALGLSEEQFVALCGAHDLGRHVTLLQMSKSCLKELTRDCLENAPVLMPFVAEDPDRFSNTYFKKLLEWNDRKIKLGEVAFIPTDVDLVVDKGLRRYVSKFARDKSAFYSSFKSAYQTIMDAGATTIKSY